ncbi:MAG: diacylglycerol kinase [Deltaproteobacteria bacterium]|nr:diacylglycerol kinase [Deltaproteobacteria bacterium]
MKPKNWLESLNCAIEGILYVAKTQRHMRYHFITAVAVLVLSLFLNLSWIEFSLLAFCITLVLFAEVMNTAIEVTIDLISEEFHPLARIAKDVAAGAVLLAVTGSLTIGYVILSRHIFPPASETLREVRHSKADMAIVSLLLVIIAVIITKARFGKGTPLHGGMPSGHSAIAFSVWTAITLITLDPMVATITFGLAIMVSHSRMIMGIHTFWEVIAGALLGTFITLIIFQVFG